MVTSLLNFVDLQNFKAKMEVGSVVATCILAGKDIVRSNSYFAFLSFLERKAI